MTKKKQLIKSSENKIIFGVCGGLGEYFEVIYLLFALLMPASEK
jgi:phage shock protein PspC (stress-responsive transcriptional regulator)